MQLLEDWIKEVFINKADLLLITFNSMWKSSFKEVELIEKILESHGIGKGSSILELGCGNGRISIGLAKKGYRVTGVDISPKFIEDAKRKAEKEKANVEFIIGDVRELDRILPNRYFDVILFHWGTIIGYYDEETDIKILSLCKKHVKSNGKLLITRLANRDTTALIYSFFGGKCSYISYDDNIVVVEEVEFNPITSRMSSKWIYYVRKGRDLMYMDELKYSIRLYSLHELVEIASKAGWTLEKVYTGIDRLEEVRRPALTPVLHYVFKPR